MPTDIWGINLLLNFYNPSCAILLRQKGMAGNYMCGRAGVPGNAYFRSNQKHVSYECPGAI